MGQQKLLKYFVMSSAFLSVATSIWAREHTDLFTTPRAIAMGRAVTAIADDYTAVHYNPAGLALVEERELRLPDLIYVHATPGILDLKDAIKDAKANQTDPIASQLARFDGTNASLGIDAMGLAWFKKRWAFAINPFSLKSSIRVRTPSVLFLKVNARVTTDSGFSLGYAQPFLNNHLRAGFMIRPVIVRAGFDRMLSNNEVTDFNDPKEIAGAGWGTDFDIGVQGNLDPIRIFKMDIKPMAGIAAQNVLGSKFSHRIREETLKGTVPALEQKVNIGVAASIENMGKFKPTLSVEYRDIGIHMSTIEHLSIGAELALKLRSWFNGALRAHLYKGNIGGGIGGNLGPGNLELGTYAVNLGNGAGVGVDRRYYVQASLVF